MVGKERIFDLAEQVFKKSPADQTELSMMSDETWLTRFANNGIHQNVCEVQNQIAIRVVLGNKCGAATTDSLGPDDLLKTLDRAVSQARLLPGDPEFPGLPATGEAPSVDAVDAETEAMTPEDRAHAVLEVVSRARQHDLQAYGYYSTSSPEVAVANSLGVRAYHRGTEADCVAIVTAPGTSGYARLLSRRKSEVCPVSVAETAIQKCVAGKNPRPLEPGDYEVVLSEDAFADLISSMALGFDAGAVSEGRSPIASFVGRKVLGENVTVVDDGTRLDGLPLPFDFEGRPRKKLTLVENGVIKDLVYDAKGAAKAGKEPTGHAVPPFVRAFGVRAVPTHIFVAPGDSSLEEMIKSTKRGILITRLWYNRMVHPMRTLITGMTRDGTFYIEDGEVKYPILNMRYTQAVVLALNAIEMMSKKTKIRSIGFGSISVPSVKISKFTFTGVTEH